MGDFYVRGEEVAESLAMGVENEGSGHIGQERHGFDVCRGVGRYARRPYTGGLFNNWGWSWRMT